MASHEASHCILDFLEGGKDQKKEPPYGADVLRLWVASADYSSDIMVGIKP